MSLWLKWRAQFEAATPPSLESIHRNLYQEINSVSQADCNSMATILNNLIKDFSFSKYANDLVEQIIIASNSLDESMIGEIGVKEGSLKIQSKALSSAWADYRTIQNQLKQTTDPLLYSQGLESLQSAKAKALSISGKLNSLRGQLLESFLQNIGQILQQELPDLVNAGTNEALNELLKNNLQISGDLNLTQTQGQTRSSVDIVIGDEFIKTISSQNKVDVTIPSPFSDGHEWFISAKNYSSLMHNIHLLSNASLIGLISQGMPASANKYVYNALTIPSAQSGWLSANLNQIKKIFAIQALAGQKASEIKANVLCLSLGNVKDPIRFISIGSLLSDVFNSDLTDQAFIFSPQLETSLPLGDGEARQESIFEALNNFTVSVELSKDFMKLNYLRKLT